MEYFGFNFVKKLIENLSDLRLWYVSLDKTFPIALIISLIVQVIAGLNGFEITLVDDFQKDIKYIEVLSDNYYSNGMENDIQIKDDIKVNNKVDETKDFMEIKWVGFTFIVWITKMFMST